MKRRLLIIAGALAALSSGTAFAQQGAIRHVHDPCVIKEGNVYYMFSTGHGITIRRSPDMFRWEGAGRVFAEDVPAWSAKEIPGTKFPWAPDISFFNDRYHLYYSISTFGKKKSCIGLATNKTLNPASPHYRWVDHGKVVESGANSNFNAIDPNVVLDEKGRPWLSFGSFWTGLKLVALDQKTGKPSPQSGNLISIAARPSTAIEAPFIVRKNGYYYLFASFDFCCKGADSTYNIVVGRSRKVTGPYLDRNGKPMLNGGGTQILAGYDNVRGPGHNAVLLDGRRDWLVHHFYNANDEGTPTMQIRPLTWDADGWPIAGKPLGSPAGNTSGDQRPTQEPSAGKSSPAGPGQVWEWQVSGQEPFKLWIYANGTIGRAPDQAPDPNFTWARSGKKITIRWPQGWIDTMQVQPGGKTLSGQNQHGAEIKARLIRKIPK